MKDKLFNALKTAYSNLGLGDEYLKSHAAMLGVTGLVTDENLADVVAKQKEVLEERQREFDRARSAKSELEKKLRETEEALKANGGEPKDEPKEGNDKEPEWARKLREQFEASEKRVAELKEKAEKEAAERAKGEREAKILAKARELGITKERIEQGFVIADDADDAAINAYLSGVRTHEVSMGLEKKDAFMGASSEDKIAEEARQWAEKL